MKLKKFEQKDRYGNMFSIEFDTSIPEMSTIPDHPGDPKGPDTVPAWLTPGEFVMNAEAVRMFEPQIEQMNNAGRAIQAEQGGTIPEYAAEGTKVSLPKTRPERPEIPAVDPQQLYKMLRARNFTDAAARGIIANFSAESNLQPDARQIGGGPGMGLAQWESGGRFDTDPLNLVDFSHKRGTNWTDPETQLDFMLAEMDNSDEYGGVRDAINAAKSPAAAAKMFLEGYEKANPKHKTYPTSMENRMQFASNFQPAQEEPTMLASLMDMFGTKEAQAETVPAMEQASIPQPDININSATPVLTAMTGKTMPVTSTIADMLSAARTQYKAPGGLVDDPEADAIRQLTELAQQATATQGSYIGDEVLEEGGANYDAARHAEEIRMRREMAQQAEDSAQANEFAMSAPSVIDNLGPDTTVPAMPAATPPVNPDVRSINKFGKTTEYQKEGDKWYRIKDDGSLAKDPATGLTALNLNTKDSPITSASTTASLPVPPSIAASSPVVDNLGPDTTVPEADAEVPKPDDQTYLHEASNVIYTVDPRSGMLVDGYGHPANMAIQNEFNQKNAGTSTDETARPEFAVTPIRTKTVDELAAEATDLQKKAQEEVNQKGQVSAETSTALAQNAGQSAQAQKKETEVKLEEQAVEAKRVEEAQTNKDTLMSDYETAKRVAEQAGVTNFPSFDDWKSKQGITTDTDTGTSTPSATNNQKSEVLAHITKNITSINDGSADGKTESDAKTAVTNAGADGNDKVNKAESFLSGIFGDLFDTGELKRMAILYAGSRLMGASHGGSLNWAAKSYLTRVDAKSAAHAATVKELITGDKHTPKSINLFKKTKDYSVLVPKGVVASPTGDKQMWYSPEGKRIQAEKYKIGKDSHIWSADGGKTAIPSAWHQDAARVPTTDKYNDRIKSEVPLLKASLEELATTIGDVTPGNAEKGIKRTQKTSITPTNAALEAAQWAAKNGLDVATMNTYIEQAYRMAVQQSGGPNNIKPESLLPYLNQLKLRQDTGQSDLFNVTDKNGAVVPMDAVKIEELSRTFIKRAGGEGGISDGRNRDAVNLFWTKAAEIWNTKVAENPDIIEEYEAQAGPNETAFYAYARTQLNLPIATE